MKEIDDPLMPCGKCNPDFARDYAGYIDLDDEVAYGTTAEELMKAWWAILTKYYRSHLCRRCHALLWAYPYAS